MKIQDPENPEYDAAMAYIRRIDMDCRIEDGAIIFGRGDGVWDISLSKCATHAAILSWVLCLSKKQWITPAVLDKFARLAADYHKLTIPN